MTGAYSDKAPAVGFFYPVTDDTELVLYSTANRAMTFRAGMLDIKATRATQGVQVMVLRAKHTVIRAQRAQDVGFSDPKRYLTRTIPSTGAVLKDEDLPNPQMTFS